MTDDNTLNERIAKAADVIGRMREEIRKAVVGQDDVLDQVIVTLIASGHVLVEGVPGLGKTLLVKALAKTFGGQFARIQFTPDLMPSDVTGHAMFDQSANQFRIRKGPVFTNLLLADEINRAPAKTQSALLEVMQEAQITIEGHAMKLAPPFMTLATQNPIELEGTYPLPEAQLDRFLLKILIDYPSEAEEQALVARVTTGRAGDTLDVSEVQTVVDPATVLVVQKLAGEVRVDEQVNAYAVRIARATREWPGVAMGAGPRGGIALVRAARAQALLEGRGFVIPDDVKRLAAPCLRHRVILAPELSIEGSKPDDVLRGIVEKVPAPRT
jgi:MoxR-like ATPase